ncbi:hypothetical protein BHU72_12690 [Desulfuribacillus stibiiarsenatis]|uniref:Uncharacterized protein n=1 Tax=Desulfuribacillus stibiiarsenatis TaxID=1390249 RepID=A0A1E5L2H1_9FIRM|nr:hypothetical protein [Desulfuribacillus stibiiarsenatis]OEH84251.1 hypothetical protein BHU72_12690 [Desulfuribacillus stibiiarsenatis]
MKYLNLIETFHEWKEVNHLPATAIALWFALLHKSNKCGCKHEFTLPNVILQHAAGLSRKQLDAARVALIEANLIYYERSNRVNQAGKYTLLLTDYLGQQKDQQKDQQNEHAPVK